MFFEDNKTCIKLERKYTDIRYQKSLPKIPKII